MRIILFHHGEKKHLFTSATETRRSHCEERSDVAISSFLLLPPGAPFLLSFLALRVFPKETSGNFLTCLEIERPDCFGAYPGFYG
jgi:hypothetical protein